ncbi:tetratricopeptide repeat-containing glycosyltransferase family 2 protein [Paenibacillus psychroresistens]|nr:glycosyltransferase family 2 protein [Paenibacillus psychroresistens]
MNEPRTIESMHAPIIAALQTKRYLEAEMMACEAVQAAPLVAQSWVLLGEALLQQGIGITAAQIFERAWLLDPEAVWIGAVQKALQAIKKPTKSDIVAKLLEVPSVTITAAVLVKNEERLIEKCLSHLADAVDEIVVIDTGSTDRTIEIAQSMPKVRLIHYAWSDDFAAARNAGLAAITTDWVLWVDGDELLFKEDIPYVRQIAGLFHSSPVAPILHIWQNNIVNGKVTPDVSQSRMFAMNRGLIYSGKVHEQVISAEFGMYEADHRNAKVRIRVNHDGYEPTIMQQKNKLQRNITLLKQMVVDEPDNPGWWYFYGRETFGGGDTVKALEILLRTEQLAEQQPRFGRMVEVYMLMVKIYMPLNQLDEAEAACHKALAIFNDYPDASFFLAQINVRRAIQQAKEAEKNIKKAKQDFTTYRSSVSADHQISQWKADMLLADVARLAGKLPEAQQIYKQIQARFPEMKELEVRLNQLEQTGDQLKHGSKL